MTLQGGREVPLILSRGDPLLVWLFNAIDACNSIRHHHHDHGISFRCFTIRAPGSSAPKGKCNLDRTSPRLVMNN